MENLALSHCFLTVDDHEKALVFYRDVLGLEVRNDVSMENFRWLTVSPPAQPGLEIVLESPGANPDISADDRAAISGLLAKGILGRLVFRTEDCDAAFEAVAASGAEVVQEPMDQPYGVRDCAFRDPAGNLVRLSQPKR